MLSYKTLSRTVTWREAFIQPLDARMRAVAARLVAWGARRRAARTARHDLRMMSNHELRDIGLTRFMVFSDPSNAAIEIWSRI